MNAPGSNRIISIILAIIVLAVAGTSIYFVLNKRESLPEEPQVEDVVPKPTSVTEKDGDPELESKLAAAEEEIAALRAQMNTASTVDAEASAPGDIEEQSAKESEADSPGDIQKRIENVQIKIIADMVYNPFFEEVSLDPETEASSRELILDAFGEMSKLQQGSMMKGDRIATEVKAEMDVIEALLEEELAKVLDGDKFGAWKRYEEYGDAVLYEALLDGQLRMMAPNLTTESHEAVMEVFAEELVLSIMAFEESSEVYSLTNYNDAQLKALTKGLERLQTTLDFAQYGYASGFVQQAEAMFDALAGKTQEP